MNISRPFLLASSITTTSLDLFHRCFIACAAEIWNSAQLDHIHSTDCQFWTVLACKMQHVICNVQLDSVLTKVVVLLWVCVYHKKCLQVTYD